MELFIIILIVAGVLFFMISKLMRNNTINHLKKRGITLLARYVQSEQAEDSFNDRIYVQAEDGRIFKSDRTTYRFSESWLRNQIFTVYLGDEESYFVDLEINILKPKFLIPIIGKKRIYEEGIVIPTVPCAYEEVRITENNVSKTVYRLYVQEKEGAKRVFQSRTIRMYNPIWFEQNNITVIVHPEDERKYVVDFVEPGIGEMIVDHVEHVINTYQASN